jgi:hypothetical protein
MEFKGAIGVVRRRAGWLGGLASAMLLFLMVVTATAEPPERLKRLMDRGGLTPAGHISGIHQMDRNRVLLLLPATFGAAGAIGGSGSSVANGGFWISTNNPYIFSSGPVMGATIPSQTAGKRDTVVFIGGPFPQQSPGSALFPELAASGGVGVFWDSTEEADIAAGFPAPCTVDDFRVQLFPSLSPFRGLPFPGFADQTVCGATNDVLGPISTDAAGRRMGAEVVYTLFAFSVPAVQDFVFVAFRIFNASQFVNASNAPIQIPGPYDLEEMSVGIAIDPDIGDSGDDQITFFPELDTMVYWDNNFAEPGFVGVPGFGAVMYLKTPTDPATGEEVGLANFTLFVRGTIRPDPESAQEWYEGLTGDPDFVAFEVQPTDIRGLAASGLFTLPAGEFTEIYGAYFFADVFGSPPAQLLAESPFTRVGGVLIPNPAANDHPAFTNIKRVAPTAQAVFNAGFIVPTAPPQPNYTLIPGDGQVTVVWGATAVTAINPFAKVARDPFARLPNNQPDPEAPGTGVFLEAETVVYDPATDTFRTAAELGLTGVEVTNAAFNPRFTIRDFQGFRVYRSRTGALSDAELIAQFDLVDDITGGDFCVAAVPVFDEEGELIQVVCIEQENFPLGTNTGLAFSIVDRGGTFPNPSAGPGLINGIPVFYSVTAYSVNCGQTPVSGPFDPFEVELLPPAACLTLESGLAPLRSTTPRTESSAFVSASAQFVALTAGGEVCDTNEPTATVDENTGKYIDFVDCSNAVIASTVTPIRGLNIPTGNFILKIDSIQAKSVDWSAADGYVLAFTAGNRVWFHWEREDGSLATEMSPSVGFFEQGHTFFGASETAVSFSFDTDPSDVGSDLSLEIFVVSDFSVAEDLEVNGQSLHLLELGGTHAGEARPHRIEGSSLASVVIIGNARNRGGTAREYSHPGPFAQGGTSYELTWNVEGGSFSGTLRVVPGGEEVPHGGRPKGPDNPSTPADFISGYNWGFVGPGTPAEVTGAVFPFGGPLKDSIDLAAGSTFAIMVPGQSVYIEGINQLPADGDVWTILIDTGSQRALFGRDSESEAGANEPVPPFSYHDVNDHSEQGLVLSPVPYDRGIVNVYQGSMWRLSLAGGANELAAADLSRITVVPNPFIVANEITRGQGRQRMLFNNLPPVATIRIYTISGNLVRIMEHSDGSGTAEWDVRTRFDLIAASGNYYFHVTTPDGRTHLGRLAIVN